MKRLTTIRSLESGKHGQVLLCILSAVLVASCQTAPAPNQPSAAGAVTASADHHVDSHDDMDKPLTKAPNANFPSPERELEDKQAALAKQAAESGDPSFLRTKSLNSQFRAFAAGDKIRVHSLDVGAGSCIVVECPASTDVLVYDCGTLKQTPLDLTDDQIKSRVAGLVQNSEPMIALSHAHADHVNLMPFVFDDTKVRSIWIGGLQTDYGSDTDENGLKSDLHAWISKKVAEGATLHHGFDVGFDNGGEAVSEMQCGDAETFILTVNNDPSGAGDNRRMHANSLILLVRYDEFKAIFTGDAVGEAEAAAIASYGALVGDTTLLFSSHHGASSNNSNSDSWVDAVRPHIVVYSADTMPTYGHPKGVVVDRYRARGSLKTTKEHSIWTDPTELDSPKEATTLAEYVTELNGTITVESDGANKVTVECSRSPNCW